MAAEAGKLNFTQQSIEKVLYPPPNEQWKIVFGTFFSSPKHQLAVDMRCKQTNKQKTTLFDRLKRKKNAIVSNFIKIIQVVKHLRLKNTSHGSAIIYLYMCRMSNKHT